MDHVMGTRPANYIQALEYTSGNGPKRVTPIGPLPTDALPLIIPKPAKKPRKPRAPTEKSLAKAKAKAERAGQRTLKRDKTYDAKKAAMQVL